MLTYTSGEDLAVVVPFIRDDELFVPDGGTATWIVRGQDGTIIGGLGGTLTGLTDSSCTITILAAHNAIATGLRFEKRTVIVRGTVGGFPFEMHQLYRLSPWLNLTVTCDSVRTFVGLDASELPDADIDILGAYYRFADQVGDAVLATALATGTFEEQLANNAVKGWAVYRAIPGLRQRVAKQESDGTRQFQRFNIDFVQLETDAYYQVTLGLRQFIPTFNDASSMPFFLVTSPTDPVSGV